MNETAERRKEATARFHEKVAKQFELLGRTKDAECAREQARKARASQSDVWSGPR